jgi:hypothetical protein
LVVLEIGKAKYLSAPLRTCGSQAATFCRKVPPSCSGCWILINEWNCTKIVFDNSTICDLVCKLFLSSQFPASNSEDNRRRRERQFCCNLTLVLNMIVININIDLKLMKWQGVDWINLTQDRYQWRALVDVVMKLRLQKRLSHC